MPTSSGMTALFLQKISSVAELRPCLAYSWLQKKQEKSRVFSKFFRRAAVKHSPLALKLILLVENKWEGVLCYKAGLWPYRHGFPSVVEGISAAWQSGWPQCYVPSYPAHGVRRQQSDAVCVLSPTIHLPMGDSWLPWCFSTGPQDLVPLFQQRIGPHFTFILQSQKQNKKPKAPHTWKGCWKDWWLQKWRGEQKIASQCYDSGPSEMAENESENIIVTIIHIHECTLTVNPPPPQICEPLSQRLLSLADL